MDRMTGMKIAVLAADREYVQRLCDFMNRKRSFPFEALAFTQADALLAFRQRQGAQTVQAVLIHSALYTDELAAQLAGNREWQVFLLDEDDDPAKHLPDSVKRISRYQPADMIMEQILQGMSGGIGSDEPERSIPTICIYSPIGRCGKTSFAMTLGQVLGEERKVLYLNLEDYSWTGLLPADGAGQGDITDLIYLLREDPGNMVTRMGTVIRTIGRLDFVPPAFSSADLKDVGSAEWRALLDAITRTGEYDLLILDIGSQVRDAYRLLQSATHVFMPVLTDELSRAKINAFIRILSASGMQSLAGRIVAVNVPAVALHPLSRGFAEELVHSQIGDYVRRLCKARGLL